MGRVGLEPTYCKVHYDDLLMQIGFTDQCRYLPNFCYGKRNRTSVPTAVSLGVPGPLEDTIEKLLSHKVLLAALPPFDYRVKTYQKHHTPNASVLWALCDFVDRMGIEPTTRILQRSIASLGNMPAHNDLLE